MILLDYHEMGLKSEPLLSGDLTIDEYLKRVNARGASLRRRRRRRRRGGEEGEGLEENA